MFFKELRKRLQVRRKVSKSLRKIRGKISGGFKRAGRYFKPSASQRTNHSPPDWQDHDDVPVWFLPRHNVFPDIIEGRWKKGNLLNKGRFGEIFEVHDIRSGQDLVMKVERTHRGCLAKEVMVYEDLQKVSPKVHGFPFMHAHGTAENFNYLIVDRLDKSLEDIHKAKGEEIDIEHVLELAIQAVTRLEQLHKLGYVHCDVKPANLMVEQNDPNSLYLIDFGSVRKFVDGYGNHIPKQKAWFRGTREFASPNVNQGWEHSRRDDLFSVAYSLYYMIECGFPWIVKEKPAAKKKNLDDQEDMDEAQISEGDGGDSGRCRSLHELQTLQSVPSLQNLCDPVPMLQEFFEYLYEMDFEEEPDYEYLRGILSEWLSCMA